MKTNRITTAHSVVKLCVTALCVLLLTSCGAKLAYNSLDVVVPWFLDDYMSFDDDQEQFVNNALSQHLEWHRTTQLPKYIELLDNIQSDMETHVSKDQVHGYYNTSNDFWKNMVVRFTPDITEFLTTIDNEQAKELFSSLRYENEEMKSEFVKLSPEEAQEGRIERMNERFERWLDELTPQQTKAIETWSKQLTPISEYWMDNRIKWLSEFEQSIAIRDQRDVFAQKLNNLFLNYDNKRSTEYQSALNHNQQLTIQLIVDVERQLTKEQRQYLLEEIEDMKQLLVELNGDTG